MNGYMHNEMTTWACRSAGAVDPIWQTDIAGTAKSSCYPDSYREGEADPKNVDWDPLWRELILIPQPDGTRRPVHSLIRTLRLRDSYPPLLKYEIDLAIRAFRNGQAELGRKAIGIISHIIGDTVQAAHTTDNVLVNQMYPQKNTRFMMHPFIEQVVSPLPYDEPYKPRILGDADLLVYRLTEELEAARRASIAEIPILLDGLLHHNPAQAQASAKRSALMGCKLIADTMATVSAIANRRQPAPAPFSLTELIPCEQDVDNMFNYEPMIDAIPSQHFDCPTQLNIGEGPVSGICLLPMMEACYPLVRQSYAAYRLPGKAYTTFSAWIGIQRFATPEEVPYYSRANETSAVFEVRLDDRTVYRSQPIDDTIAPVPVRIPLGNARKITLYVRDARDPNPQTKFVYPVFAKPIVSVD